MKLESAPPGAVRLIQSLRDLGYECHTAIADLIDNSVAANASEIYVDIHAKEKAHPAYVVISDDGDGMDNDSLHESMRWGAFQEYSSQDLGKYGLGLKTASLSQCRILSVASKPAPARGQRSRRTIKRWDLDHVEKVDNWSLQTLEESDLKDWEREVFKSNLKREHGTVVLWSDLEEALPELSSASDKDRQRALAAVLIDVSEHLRMVFHKFLQHKVPGRRKLKIFVGETQLLPWDPFCTDEDNTVSLKLAEYKIKIPGKDSKSEKIILHPYILPNIDDFSTPEARKDAAGPRGWAHQQGFYFYRNGRMLQSGGWSYMRTSDEHTKLLRIAVEFPPELDKAFGLNITKMRALIPREARDDIGEDITKWVKSAKSYYNKLGPANSDVSPARTSKKSGSHAKEAQLAYQPSSVKIGGVTFALSNAPGSKLTAVNSGPNGGVKIVIPQKHECATIFDKNLGRTGDLKKLCLSIFGILEALSESRMKSKDIPWGPLKTALRRVL